MARKALLVCGILASLIYVGADLLAALRWASYSYSSQMISELMAIDTPTRPLLVVLFSAHNLLAIAFGVGVWVAAGQKRAVRTTAILLVGYGVVGEFALLFCPMHLREAAKSATDTRHIIATAVLVLLTLLFIGFGSVARGRTFRLYSIATIVVLFVFGALAGWQGARIDKGLPTPGFGLLERVNIYSSMAWMLVLAVLLLRVRDEVPVRGERPVTPRHLTESDREERSI